MNDTEEMVDTSDLDLLDDDKRHARCTYCQPDVGALQTFISLCGVRAVHRTARPVDSQTPPVNACEECKRLWYEPCARCGG